VLFQQSDYYSNKGGKNVRSNYYWCRPRRLFFSYQGQPKWIKSSNSRKKYLGGTCANVGCIPTKTYVHATTVINEMKECSDFGIMAQYKLDLNRLREKKNSIVKSLNAGIEYLLKKNSVDIIWGEAKFLDSNKIEVSKKEYEGKNFIIATGSSVSVPLIKGIDKSGIITSEQALEMEKIPGKIVIIGAGIIGLEFAHIYNFLGSQVTLVEMLPELLPMLDNDIKEIYMNLQNNRNIQLHLDCKVKEIVDGLKVKIIEDEKEYTIECDTVLLATGRKANINGIDALSLEIGSRGIKVNGKLQTNINNIYCIGDANGISQLAHVATYQGDIAVRNILGENMEANYNIVPSCLYTDPEISWVGLNEIQAKTKFDEVKTGTFPYMASGRAQTMGSTNGMIKIITGGSYDQVVGMQIIGKSASELIHTEAFSFNQ